MANLSLQERFERVENNRRLAYEIAKRWSIPKGGDINPLFELFRDDATVTSMARNGDLPVIDGTLNIKNFSVWVYKQSQVTDVKVNVAGVTADENRIALEATTEMTIDGKPYSNVYHWLFEIKDGKIGDARIYFDTLHGQKAMEWIAKETEGV